MNSITRRLALAVLGTLALVSCTSSGSQRAAPASSGGWVFAFLSGGPEAASKTKEERQLIQLAHLGNITKLANERKLIVAGPFGNERPAPDLRGVFIFDTNDLEEARAWTSTDPAVQAGVLAMELAPLATDAPLKRSLTLYQEREAAAKAEGRQLKMEEMIRPYVMLLGQDAHALDGLVADLRAQKKLVLDGALSGSTRGQRLVVIDAPDVASGKDLLGKHAASIGEHTLSVWYASHTLREMNEPGG